MAHKSEDDRITELEDEFIRMEERVSKLNRFISEYPLEVQTLGQPIGGLHYSTFVRASDDDDGGKVTLTDCEWETIHNDRRTSIKVHLKVGSAEMEVNDEDATPLSRCNWIRASGKVRVHGTGGHGRQAQVEWKPV